MSVKKQEFESWLNSAPEVEPDAEDLEAIARSEKSKDETAVPLSDVSYNGKISLRVPRSLHRELVENAKSEGVSLNQYILFKLAK